MRGKPYRLTFLSRQHGEKQDVGHCLSSSDQIYYHKSPLKANRTIDREIRQNNTIDNFVSLIIIHMNENEKQHLRS